LRSANVPDLIDVATMVGLMQEFGTMAEHETTFHLDRCYEALDRELVHCGADIRRIAA
jgi:UDP-N-acetylglucosamine enolpyruvyl transferase